MAGQTPEVVEFAMAQPGERPVLGVSLEDLAQKRCTSIMPCDCRGALPARRQIRCTTKAKEVTLDRYHARWFTKSRQVRHGLTDGIGLRAWHRGKLTPGGDLE